LVAPAAAFPVKTSPAGTAPAGSASAAFNANNPRRRPGRDAPAVRYSNGITGENTDQGVTPPPQHG